MFHWTVTQKKLHYQLYIDCVECKWKIKNFFIHCCEHSPPSKLANCSSGTLPFLRFPCEFFRSFSPAIPPRFFHEKQFQEDELFIFTLFPSSEERSYHKTSLMCSNVHSAFTFFQIFKNSSLTHTRDTKRSLLDASFLLIIYDNFFLVSFYSLTILLSRTLDWTFFS